jgi:hypothetical protein
VMVSSSNNDVQWQQQYAAVVGGVLSKCYGRVQPPTTRGFGRRELVLCPRHAAHWFIRLGRRLP